MNSGWRHDKSCAYLYDTEERIGNLSSGYHTFRGIRSGLPVITPGTGRGGDVPARLSRAGRPMVARMDG